MRSVQSSEARPNLAEICVNIVFDSFASAKARQHKTEQEPYQQTACHSHGGVLIYGNGTFGKFF